MICEKVSRKEESGKIGMRSEELRYRFAMIYKKEKEGRRMIDERIIASAEVVLVADFRSIRPGVARMPAA